MSDFSKAVAAYTWHEVTCSSRMVQMRWPLLAKLLSTAITTMSGLKKTLTHQWGRAISVCCGSVWDFQVGSYVLPGLSTVPVCGVCGEQKLLGCAASSFLKEMLMHERNQFHFSTDVWECFSYMVDLFYCWTWSKSACLFCFVSMVLW